jgi:hypothetical protein
MTDELVQRIMPVGEALERGLKVGHTFEARGRSYRVTDIDDDGVLAVPVGEEEPMTDERPLESVRLDQLRYRWQHVDLNPDLDPMRWKGYSILEFRCRNDSEKMLVEDSPEGKLWRSIREGGLKNPLIVKRYGDEYFVIVGNTRLAVLRGMASEDARHWNANPKMIRKRPTSGPGCDAWLSVPCIVAKQTDSWNDWTEARMFSAPVDESGNSPIEERRHFERLKYALLYEEYGYGMGELRLAALRGYLNSWSGYEEGTTWLDVGCGKAETRDVARENGLQWEGAEVLETLAHPIGPEDVELIWGVHDLSCYSTVDNRFDLVTCLDVLEHILPEDTDAALRELWRVTDKVLLLSISWSEDDGGKQIGAKLHINIRSREAWVDLIEDACPGLSALRVFDEDAGGATFEVRR